MANANTQQPAKKRGKISTYFREVKSELKKVSWPTFGKVVSQTGVVLAVTLIFTVVLFGFDSLLGFLFNLLIGA